LRLPKAADRFRRDGEAGETIFERGDGMKDITSLIRELSDQADAHLACFGRERQDLTRLDFRPGSPGPADSWGHDPETIIRTMLDGAEPAVPAIWPGKSQIGRAHV
jgi:hypothetical protein